MSEELAKDDLPDDGQDALREPDEDVPGVGERLRHARQQAGYTLEDVASQTRIPQRHLLAIEEDAFDRLPARTYAVGFSRSYARMLGMDEREIADQVRAQLAASGRQKGERPERFEPGDPGRVPSRGLAWFSAFAIVVLLAGGFAFYRTYFAPGMGPPALQEERLASERQAAGGALDLGEPSGPSPDGQVVFTALEDGIWARFYDREGERLYEAQMAEGESFEVPQGVEGPQIWTGRPDAFRITIDGREVPPLAEEDQVMRDVEISAAALLSRPGGGGEGSPPQDGAGAAQDTASAP